MIYRFAILVLCLQGWLAAQAPVAGAKITAVSRSVLRVEAHQCEGAGGGFSDRIATGFIWGDASSAVTAWHVVTGCHSVNVYYEEAKLSRPAHITKVRRDSDLALLAIDNAPSTTPLSEQPQAPAVNEDLETLGFPLQTAKMSSTRLNLRFGSGKLGDIVPANVAQTIAQFKSPSLDLQITAIEGHLVAGLSGAPIFDGQGKVVAVADGGLENGAVGISWGVPVANLHDLAHSTDTGALTTAQARSSAAKSAALFAAESEASNQGELTCSGMSLTKIRTASFGQIVQSVDDALGLQQLINYFNVDPSSYSFDIYQHLPSGATFVVPEGATLTPDDHGCVASLNQGEIIFRVELGTAGTVPQLELLSSQFEKDLVHGHTQNWYPDQQFTYLAPIFRFDGLIVRRRAYVHLDPALVMSLGNPPQNGYLFETIAFRHTVLVTASVINRVATMKNNQLAVFCRQNPMGPNCNAVNARTKAWIESVLALQLTTFPVG